MVAWQGGFRFRGCPCHSWVHFKAKFILELVLLDEPFLHVVLIPLVVPCDDNKLVNLHAEEIDKLLEPLRHAALHDMSLHETEALVVYWCIAVDIGDTRAVHVDVVVIPSGSFTVVPVSVIPVVVVRLDHFV